MLLIYFNKFKYINNLFRYDKYADIIFVYIKKKNIYVNIFSIYPTLINQ